MRTREIPKQQWQVFCDEFSRQHEGWLVTLEIFGEVGAQTETVGLPLIGVSVDQKDNENTLSILLGGKSGKHVTHTIVDPARLWIAETETGAHEALKIETNEGEGMLLRFHATALPEMVDGVVLDPAD